MYHQVSPADHPSFNRHLSVTVERFDQQIGYLVGKGYRFITMADMFDADSAEFQRRNYAVITFDDIFQTFYDYALPVLKKHQVSATAYVIGNSLTGKPYQDLDPAGLEPLTQAQLADLMQHGVEIGSHTMSHRQLATLSIEDARWELAESYNLIKQITGKDHINFCYPSGSHRQEHFALLREIGYQSAVITERGNRHDLGSPYNLKRVKVSQKHTGIKLLYLCSRLYDLMYTYKKSS